MVQRSTSSVTAMEVARGLAAHEYDSPSADEVQSIHLALHNDYLPRLEDADVVEYDADELAIRPGVNFDGVMTFLADVNDSDLPWAGR